MKVHQHVYVLNQSIITNSCSTSRGFAPDPLTNRKTPGSYWGSAPRPSYRRALHVFPITPHFETSSLATRYVETRMDIIARNNLISTL